MAKLKGLFESSWITFFLRSFAQVGFFQLMRRRRWGSSLASGLVILAQITLFFEAQATQNQRPPQGMRQAEYLVYEVEPELVTFEFYQGFFSYNLRAHFNNNAVIRASVYNWLISSRSDSRMQQESLNSLQLALSQEPIQIRQLSPGIVNIARSDEDAKRIEEDFFACDEIKRHATWNRRKLVIRPQAHRDLSGQTEICSLGAERPLNFD